MISLMEAYSEKKKYALACCLQVDGWLSLDEAGALFDAAYFSPGPIVEIGSWQGRSTIPLAMGSQFGSGQPVICIDSFVGVPPLNRKTAHGRNPGWQSSSPEALRANLDKFGCGDNVTIVPLSSLEAVPEVFNGTSPAVSGIGVLFIDGDHAYEAVYQDMRAYMPKVILGGTLLMHDCDVGDPGVVRAVNELLLPDSTRWRMRGRAGSMILAQRANDERFSVAVACPGGQFCWGAVSGLLDASRRHQTLCINNGNGFDDMNALWAQAQNLYEAGKITHFAMLHSDVVPMAYWLDVLIGEMEDRSLDMISAIIPIKDARGVTSSGIGSLSNPWGAFRRFTMRETMSIPEMLQLSDTPYADDPDKFLLHNTGCFVCDLRNPLFSSTREDGSLRCFFDFPTKITRSEQGPNAGQWINHRESEDWFFSRAVHELGGKTALTRRVTLAHRGALDYINYAPWGDYEVDENTRRFWDEPEPQNVE